MANHGRWPRLLRAILAVLAPLLLVGAAGGVMRVADFGSYWSAARVNLTGGNPYDPADLLPEQQRIEPDKSEALPPLGPPWSIGFVTPFACPDFPVARWAWLALTAAGIAWSAWELSRLYCCRPDRRWVLIVLAFTFYPVLQLLGLGQVSGASLFAMVGFLAALARGRPFFAGLFAALTLVKPQVAGFFALSVGLWLLEHRQWRVLLGVIVGAALLTGLAVIPNPRVFEQYWAAMSAGRATEMIPPTPGSLLRVLAGEAFWAALIPPAVGVVGVVGWYGMTRRQWDWPWAAQCLAFVGFFCSPYAWVYDQPLFLIPLVAVAAACNGRWLVGLFGVHLILTAIALALNAAGWQEYQFWWLAPAVLAIWWVFGRFRMPVGSR
jgi:hypothetical protein